MLFEVKSHVERQLVEERIDITGKKKKKYTFSVSKQILEIEEKWNRQRYYRTDLLGIPKERS